MSREIDTERYCWAFETWAVAASIPVDEKRIVDGACAHLRATLRGRHPTQDLCNAFLAWMRAEPSRNHPGLLKRIGKSCLLDRLVYAGEPLRTRKCPEHDGVWSGYWTREPCRHGCSFGLNLTGWIKEP